MTAFAFPNLEGGSVAPASSAVGEKIIQRIRPAAGSKFSKARCMADADEDLVLQCQNGKALAFEALVRNHQQMIHALTFRMTGSVTDAEDLAQETFIRAFDQIGKFNGKAKFSTWLYSIGIHACLNWRRNEARRFHAQNDCANEIFARQNGAEMPASENGMAQRAQAALMKLPAKQRAAIVLTIYDGLNHAEAAKILHCSETTISWRVFAAKQKLKHWLTASAKKS